MTRLNTARTSDPAPQRRCHRAAAEDVLEEPDAADDPARAEGTEVGDDAHADDLRDDPERRRPSPSPARFGFSLSTYEISIRR